MKIPRDVNGAVALQALRRLGFEKLRQSGSHLIVRKGARTVVVTIHKPIKPGTLVGLIEQAGVSVEAFCAELQASVGSRGFCGDRFATRTNCCVGIILTAPAGLSCQRLAGRAAFATDAF